MAAWLLELIDAGGAFTVLSSGGDPWRMAAWWRSSSMAEVRRRPPAACSPAAATHGVLTGGGDPRGVLPRSVLHLVFLSGDPHDALSCRWL
jgi:hypothetical protein